MNDSFQEFKKEITYPKRSSGKVLRERGIDPSKISNERDLASLSVGESLKVEIRIDPLMGTYSTYSSLISAERAKRPFVLTTSPANSPAADCIFCKPKLYGAVSPPFIEHQNGAVSYPNTFPSVVPHYVTIITESHTTDIGNLTYEDFQNYLTSGKDIANMFAKDFSNKGLEGMTDFINFGAEAGGSQPHPHAQRQGIFELTRAIEDSEVSACKQRSKDLGRDVFDWHFDNVRKSELFVYENENVFVSVPFAPRFTHQVDIIIKDENVRNYLDINEEQTNSVATAVKKTISALRNLRYKVEDELVSSPIEQMNIICHQTRFNSSSPYRMHWHICPRGPKIGGLELSGMQGISVYPETTAEAVRNLFN